MIDKTPIAVLAFVVHCMGSLLLIVVSLWIVRRVKLPCLPWAIACWVLKFPLLALLNSHFLNILLVSALPAKGISLSGIGLFSKRDAMRQYMTWYGFLSSTGFLAVTLLVVADATFLVHQLKPSINDRIPRFFGLVRRFSPAFGLLALVLAVINHILSLLMQHISP